MSKLTSHYAYRYAETFENLTKEEKVILIKALLGAIKWGNKLCQGVKR